MSLSVSTVSDEEPENDRVRRSRGWAVTAGLGALAYPGAVSLLYVTGTRAGPRALLVLPLALALGVPVIAFAALRRIDAQSRVARGVALFAFASPALYTLLYVVTAGVGTAADDRLGWCAAWAGFTLAAALWSPSPPRDAPAPRVSARLPRAHGVGAVLVVALFLAAHLANQLVALRGAAAHTAVLHALRSVYRAAWAEPMLLAILAFLAVSGAALLRAPEARGGRAGDGKWRTLQLSTGAALLPFLTAHVGVVLGARAQLHADTDWTFATGGAAGLFGSLASARLVPYYGFAVFVTLAHVTCGLRGVLIRHGYGRFAVDRVGRALLVAAGVAAAAAMAATCGVRLGGT
jgi:hypothetical protein